MSIDGPLGVSAYIQWITPSFPPNLNSSYACFKSFSDQLYHDTLLMYQKSLPE